MQKPLLVEAVVESNNKELVAEEGDELAKAVVPGLVAEAVKEAGVAENGELKRNISYKYLEF